MLFRVKNARHYVCGHYYFLTTDYGVHVMGISGATWKSDSDKDSTHMAYWLLPKQGD